MDENVLDDDPREEDTILRNKADESNRLISLSQKVKQTEKPSEKNKAVTWTKSKVIPVILSTSFQSLII